MNKVVKAFLAILIMAIISVFIFYQDIPILRRLISGNIVPLNETEIQGSFGGTQELEVDAIVIKPKTIESKVEVTGELIPNEYVEMKSEMSGILDEINFKEGEFITKGQLLVKINVDELLAQKEKLEYTKKLRESMEFRQRQLLEREAISQEEYDQALTELQTSGADINLLTTQIKKSEIKAPFSGIMGLRQVSRGAYITPSTVIAPLYSINPAKLEFSIPGKYSNEIKVGNIVSFTVESSENTFSGKVHAIEPRIDPNTRTIRLRALCPNPGNLLF